MKFDYDTLVNRQSIGNMKYITSSPQIKKNGVISYAGAEMDFKTAPVIIESIKKRCDNGLFGFTLADDSYLESIMWWMKNQRNWTVKRESIIPTYGTIHSVATAIRAFTDPGDGIIVQPPVYNRYEQAASRTNRKTAYNPLIYKGNTYCIDFENLEKCMSDEKNKLMILCNPHNPVGKVWKYGDLKEIAILAKKYNVIVFSDEIFAEVVFKDNITIPYCTIEEAADNCIVSTSLGKDFNLTGINNANMVIPDINIRRKFISQRDSDHYGSIDPMTHAALCGAYSPSGACWLEEMKKYIYGNVNYIRGFFKENLPEIDILEPEGTFMIWIDWNNLGLTEKNLFSFLLNEAYLELDPGSNYGSEGTGFARMNIASPRREIINSMELLLKAKELFFR